ncbi:MAG: LuxR family transcriptional regulator [Lacunisphaera sp.]|jgi:DNA-binding NarL/FixJ family response regulator|nr:LuxR family transcriptional regulator [Lacunisphaera sp.]MDB6165848.1 LuxR family transcriptional regulator [Lacunisphaera sp.]
MSEPRKRIFIVDDHTLVREWLANLLRQEPDFEVCGQADSASAALASMQTQPPTIAIIDLSLKGGSGLDLIKDLRRVSPATQVVVLSMHEEIYFIERAFRAGARAYVTKRDSTHRIVEAIRAVLAGQVYANADVLAQLTERMVGHSPERQPGNVELLSDREMEVFRRLGEGQGSRKIAEEMGLSMKTVQAYSARIKEKLGLANVSELIREAVRWTETKRNS